MPTTEFALDVLHRLPLAEAVLQLSQWQWDPHTLQALFDEHRGACYTRELSFDTLVALIADALLEHQGSGRQSFQRGRVNGTLSVTAQATYQKLGRLPLAVSEAFLSASTRRLLQLVPADPPADTPLPQTLRAFQVVVLDGKAIKGVPKRLRPLRQCSGGVLGGKALVAWHLASGLAVAMATDPDGDTNEAKLVPDLLPQVRPHFPAVLWLGDRQFGDPTQAAAFCGRDGDHFLVRHDGKTKFTPDPNRPAQRGVDGQGRVYEQDWGTFGGPRNKHPRYVRRLTLYRPGQETVVLITDLLDEAVYPATDLLALYLARWGIERVFQQITEVFNLRRLIGTTPKGTVFQLAFCLLLYNQIQVVRGYVAAAARRPVGSVSSELLFEDVRRQLIALHELLPAGEVALLASAIATAEQLRQRLRELLQGVWTERWQKAPAKKRAPAHSGDRKREHKSAYRLIEECRQVKSKRVQT